MECESDVLRILSIRIFRIIRDAMSSNPRRFIIALGGYRKVARRLGKPESTVHGWTTSEDGRMPPRLYRMLAELADEAGIPRPSLELFRFLPLPPVSGKGAGR
jgi:hypothetical protein